MILKSVPLDERPALQIKIMAADSLKGRRLDWGSKRKWEGNYLVQVVLGSSFNVPSYASLDVMLHLDLQSRENPNTADFVSSVSRLKAKDGFTKVHFSNFVLKVSFTSDFPQVIFAWLPFCVQTKFILFFSPTASTKLLRERSASPTISSTKWIPGRNLLP